MPLRCSQDGGDAAVGPVLLGVLGEAEAEAGVEVGRALHVGREHIEMVEPLRLHALVAVVVLQQPLALLHGEIELDRHPERIDRLQRAPLIRPLDERVPQPLALEELRRLVEVLLAADLEAEVMRLGGVALLQHQRVVLPLLDAAQVERVLRLVLDDEAERALVEGAAAAEIGDAERHMARAHDVERRIENVARHRHRCFLR